MKEYNSIPHFRYDGTLKGERLSMCKVKTKWWL